MSLFSKIGKAIGNVAKGAVKVTGSVLKTAAPIASLVPGVGSVVGAAAGVLGNVLSPDKSADVVNAVQRDGEIKVDKLETTIQHAIPTATPTEVSQLAVTAAKELTTVVPTATVDDSKSVANVSFITKAVQWVKSNLLIVAGAVIAFVYFKGSKGRGRRGRW